MNSVVVLTFSAQTPMPFSVFILDILSHHGIASSRLVITRLARQVTNPPRGCLERARLAPVAAASAAAATASVVSAPGPRGTTASAVLETAARAGNGAALLALGALSNRGPAAG